MQVLDAKYQKALEKIQYYTKKFRGKDKLYSENIDFNYPIHFEERVGYFNNKPVKRLIIRLRSSGCSWVQKTGGCTMCGFYSATGHGKKVTAKQYLLQIKNLMDEVNLDDYTIVGIYNDGNFFNENEISMNAVKGICDVLTNFKNIKRINFESRAEYLILDRVKRIKNYLKDKDLEISVGFESIKPEIIQLCINKGLQYLNYGKIFRDLQKNGIAIKPLILLKPPFLTEKESIDDVLHTINYLVLNGIYNADLEITTVMKNTLVYELWKRDLYHTAMLWSIRDLILRYKKRYGEKFNLYISPWSYSVTSIDKPKNCGKCDKEIIELFNEYNKNYDIKNLKDFYCSCIDTWNEKMQKINTMSIPERILYHLEKLENN